MDRRPPPSVRLRVNDNHITGSTSEHLSELSTQFDKRRRGDKYPPRNKYSKMFECLESMPLTV